MKLPETEIEPEVVISRQKRSPASSRGISVDQLCADSNLPVIEALARDVLVSAEFASKYYVSFQHCCGQVFSRALLLARSDSTCHSAMSSVRLSVRGRTSPPTPNRKEK